jgi:hypothetical protein
MIQVNSRTHHIPKSIDRDGCPGVVTPFYQTAKQSEGKRKPIYRQYTTMRLVLKSKDNTIKHDFPLKHIHDDLASQFLTISNSGSSNILLSRVSFECLISTIHGDIRDRISFPLKIMGVNTDREPVFSYDWLVKKYGSKENLYATLKTLYDMGRSRVNPNKCKHGHQPDYDPDSSAHDQYIRHTEQLLAAYLCLPEASSLLCEQLRGIIRAKYNDATAVKVYNIGLHMHSTKTCCGPCEYTLLGLMNQRKRFEIGLCSRPTAASRPPAWLAALPRSRPPDLVPDWLDLPRPWCRLPN